MSRHSNPVETTTKRTNGQLIRRESDFHYVDLESSLRNKVEKETATIRTLLHRTAEQVIQIGLRLKGVHELLGRDVFPGWLASQFRWSQSTAPNYMQAAARFCEVKCLVQFQTSALFELAGNKTSDAAREEALHRAQKGEIITKSLAQGIIRAHRPRPAHNSRTAAFHVARTIRDINHKVRMSSAAEADEIHQLLLELLGEVDKMRATDLQGTPTNSAPAVDAIEEEPEITPPRKKANTGGNTANRRHR